MTHRYRAVIFDFFGTLTGPIQRGPAHTRVPEILGCDPAAFDAALIRTYHARIRGDHGDLLASLAQLAAEAGGKPTRRQLVAAAWARLDAVRADIRLRPEALPLLRTLRTMGLRLGLITDCAGELPLILPSLGLTRLLDATVYSVRARLAKPDPRLYSMAYRRLGVRAGECLYIGDGGGHELSGARRAGLTAVRLASPDLAGHLTFDPEPDWSGAQVAALPHILDFLAAPTRPPEAAYWADERQLTGTLS